MPKVTIHEPKVLKASVTSSGQRLSSSLQPGNRAFSRSCPSVTMASGQHARQVEVSRR